MNIQNNNLNNMSNQNMINKKKKSVFIIILDVIRYIIGSFFILVSVFDYLKFYGLLGVLFGLSFFPVFYDYFLKKLLKVDKVYINVILSIFIPFILFFSWAFALPSSDDSDNNKDDNNKVVENKKEEKEKETDEEKAINLIKSKLPDSATFDSSALNSDNLLDIKINYNKSKLSAYVCASDAQSYSINFSGNKKINSIQFSCINDSGLFYYVKVENINKLNTSNISNNTKYFDTNYKEVKTDLSKLKSQQISDFKKSCKSLKYKDVLRNPDNYKGSNAYWFGEIVQVVSKTSYASVFRVDVTCEKYTYSKDYYCTDTVYVTYFGDQSFIEDDMVKMWGTMDGTETYTTVLGASVTIPKFDAIYMELQ